MIIVEGSKRLKRVGRPVGQLWAGSETHAQRRCIKPIEPGGDPSPPVISKATSKPKSIDSAIKAG